MSLYSPQRWICQLNGLDLTLLLSAEHRLEKFPWEFPCHYCRRDAAKAFFPIYAMTVDTSLSLPLASATKEAWLAYGFVRRDILCVCWLDRCWSTLFFSCNRRFEMVSSIFHLI